MIRRRVMASAGVSGALLPVTRLGGPSRTGMMAGALPNLVTISALDPRPLPVEKPKSVSMFLYLNPAFVNVSMPSDFM